MGADRRKVGGICLALPYSSVAQGSLSKMDSMPQTWNSAVALLCRHWYFLSAVMGKLCSSCLLWWLFKFPARELLCHLFLSKRVVLLPKAFNLVLYLQIT